MLADEGFGIFLKDWGPEGLVSFFVLSIGLGLLIPRWSMNRTIRILENQLTEALTREKILTSANEKLQETVRLQTAQLGDLMEQGRTTIALVNSIAHVASPANRGVGRHHGAD